MGNITNQAIINQIQMAGTLQANNMDAEITLKIGETPSDSSNIYFSGPLANPAVTGAVMTFSEYLMHGGTGGLDKDNNYRLDENESKPLNQLFTAAYSAAGKTDETPNVVTADELNRLAYALRDNEGNITKASVSSFQALPAAQQAERLGETFAIGETRTRSSSAGEATSLIEGTCSAH